MYSSEKQKKPSTDNLGHRDAKNDDKAKTNAKYFKALEKWLNDVGSSQYCGFFPGFSHPMIGQQMSSPHITPSSNFSISPEPLINQGFGMFTFSNEQQQPQAGEGVEYRIPPLWKRLLAETIDFIMLFFIKLAAASVIAAYFNVMEDLESFHQSEKINFELALFVSTKYLSVELVNKIFVSVYEACHLQRPANNQVGGATPGKIFLGIRVVFCNKIEPVENQPNVVRVTPATDLTFASALRRSLIKNLIFPLSIPICFPFILNNHNRIIYDVLCHTVVVEDKHIRDR